VARNYHTLNSQTRVSQAKLTSFLKKNGQHLLPMVDLITQSRIAIDELIDSLGRATIETILEVSAEQVVGPKQPGKVREGMLVWYGRQPGRVYLGDRKLAVERPRLRERRRGQNKEVVVPAYAALQNRKAMQERMLEILMNGVSTAQLPAGDSGNGGKRGHLEIQREPGDDCGLGGRSETAAGAAFG
jgi:hypothetical protein